jgi:hypothetical protein
VKGPDYLAAFRKPAVAGVAVFLGIAPIISMLRKKMPSSIAPTAASGVL